jgi:hypothetical protein
MELTKTLGRKVPTQLPMAPDAPLMDWQKPQEPPKYEPKKCTSS